MFFTNKNIFSIEFIKLIPWILIVLSIGTQPSDFHLFGESKTGTLNSTRIILALATSLLIIFIFLIKIIKNFVKKNYKIVINTRYIILYFFLIYFICQFFGYFLSLNELINSNYEDNIYLIILSFGFIAYFFLIKDSIPSEILKFYLYFIYLLICLSGIVLASVHISKSTLDGANYFSLYNSVLSQHQTFLNHELPRVTGISRTLSILNIILISLYFFNIKKNIKLALIPIIFLLSILIFGFQSRGTILCFVVSLIFLIFLFNKENLKERILIIVISILFPYLAFESLRYMQFESIKSGKNFSILKPFKSEKEVVIIPFDAESIDNIIVDKNRLLDFSSSGRMDLWNMAIKKYDKSKFFGFGPQGDRYLLRENLKKYTTNNVSNSYLYSLLSGGYIGCFFYIIIITILVSYLYKDIFTNKIFNSRNYIKEKLSLTIFVFFLIRMNFENSFAVFGVDFIILITSISIFLINEKNDNKI